jgi:hypothetical protein
MNPKFKKMAMLFVLGVFALGMKATAEEKTKEYHESWAASSMQTLEIINKFGDVKINNNNGSDVTIDVVITVEAPNENKADEMLELINVDFGKSGSTVKAETDIDKEFKSRQKFSIDYTVNIPSDKNLNISNKYGNTFVNVLNANGNFNIQYGSFTASELKAPANGNMDVSLAYGKAEIGSANDLKVEVKYSKMNFGEVKNINLESKYSVLNIEEAGDIQVESKYDTFDFEEVQSVTATTKYSHFKIEELKKGLKIDSGYGGISVEEIAPDFESISIENSYGQIKLGLSDSGYKLDASCNYCGISYPEDEFVGNKMKDNNTRTVKGKVGNRNGGNVYIRSRYGEIKLQK